jgi:hypothetical protein
MSSSDSRIDIQKQFQSLSLVATSLNSSSDELTKVIGVLDEALKKLNIGLTVWIEYQRRGVEEWEYDDDQVGYAKVNGKWGIALQRRWGNHRDDIHDYEGPWVFGEAPREMRLESLDSIPKLIEKLGQQGSDTAKRIEKKTEELRKLTGIITEVANGDLQKAPGAQTSGLSRAHQEEILNKIQEEKKFLGELLQQAMLWELLASGDLEIYFSVEKRAFAELIGGRDMIAKINAAAEKVLGHPVRAVPRIFNDGKTPSGASAVRLRK